MEQNIKLQAEDGEVVYNPDLLEDLSTWQYQATHMYSIEH